MGRVLELAKRGVPGLGLGANSLRYLNRLKATAPIAIWVNSAESSTTLLDESGNGRNGSYPADVADWTPRLAIGDGRTSPRFNGSRYANIYSASLAAAFNPLAFSVMIEIQLPDWSTAGTQRALSLAASTTNRIILDKRPFEVAGKGTWALAYTAGGTAKEFKFNTEDETGRLNLILTVNKAEDRARCYRKGVQVLSTLTGLGTWAGALASTLCVIGASNTSGASGIDGYAAWVTLWDRELPQDEAGMLGGASSPFDLPALAGDYTYSSSIEA